MRCASPRPRPAPGAASQPSPARLASRGP
jgi:hypothetical protein